MNLDLIKKLYWGNGLSLEKISNKLNTSPQVIFYHMKKNRIPISILKDKNAFFAFVAGYTDAEGSWNIIKGRKNNIWITFRLATSDFKILNQINKELRKYRINSRLYLDRKAGATMSFGTYTNDFYALWVTQMDSIFSLIDEMLKYSKHREKLYKMKLCLYAKNVISWNTIGTRVISLRKKIKNEVKEYTALAKNMAN